MTQVAVISDIHGNFDALKTVLQKIRELKADRLICLGDVVNYGPESEACLHLLKQEQMIWIQGNHDAVASGVVSHDCFRGIAGTAMDITQETLSADDRQTLKQLLQCRTTAWGYLVHASPIRPLWHAVTGFTEAMTVFRTSKYRNILVGHTHHPGAFAFRDRRVKVLTPPAQSEPFKLTLDTRSRYLINPGSVGFPRDGDWRTSFAMLEVHQDQLSSVSWHRLEYDLEATAAKMAAKRLPEELIQQLRMARR